MGLNYIYTYYLMLFWGIRITPKTSCRWELNPRHGRLNYSKSSLTKRGTLARLGEHTPTHTHRHTIRVSVALKVKWVFYPGINCYGSYSEHLPRPGIQIKGLVGILPSHQLLWFLAIAFTSTRHSNPWSPSAESQGFIY